MGSSIMKKQVSTHTCSHIRDIVRDFDNHLKQKIESEDGKINLRTGFEDIDRFTSGILPSDFILIAAPEYHGKIQFVISILLNLFKQKHDDAALIFSPDTSKHLLIQWMVCAQCEVDPSKIRNNELTEDEISALRTSMEKISKFQLYINDSVLLTNHDIESICQGFENDYDKNLSLIIVNRFHLIDGTSKIQSEQDVHSEVSLTLKRMADELKVPVITTVDIDTNDRRNEDKEDYRPMVQDLRQYGSLANDASTVFFIYRDEVYKSDSPNKNIAEIIIAKNNRGSTGIVRVGFEGRYHRFNELRELFE